MKSTEIPNGFVFYGKNGHNILVDIDDNGKMAEEEYVVTVSGWPEHIIDKNNLKRDIIVLVHSVKGSKEMLVKRLASVKMECEGKPLTVQEIIKMGKLKESVENLWDEYMKELKKKAKN